MYLIDFRVRNPAIYFAFISQCNYGQKRRPKKTREGVAKVSNRNKR